MAVGFIVVVFGVVAVEDCDFVGFVDFEVVACGIFPFVGLVV